eukprot:1160954-Pelagomonas_calceolata.AAC.9
MEASWDRARLTEALHCKVMDVSQEATSVKSTCSSYHHKSSQDWPCSKSTCILTCQTALCLRHHPKLSQLPWPSSHKSKCIVLVSPSQTITGPWPGEPTGCPAAELAGHGAGSAQTAGRGKGLR